MTILEFSKFLLNINIFFFIVSVFLYLKNWKYSHIGYRLFTVYLIFITLLQITFRVSFKFTEHAGILTNIFFMGEMLFLYFYFINVFKKKILINYIKIYTFCFFITLFSLFVYDTDILFKINGFLVTAITFGYLTFTLLYWYEALGKKIECFNFIIAGVVYHFGSIFVFLGASIFYKNNMFLALIIFNYHTFLAIVYTFFILREWKVNIYNKN